MPAASAIDDFDGEPDHDSDKQHVAGFENHDLISQYERSTENEQVLRCLELFPITIPYAERQSDHQARGGKQRNCRDCSDRPAPTGPQRYSELRSAHENNLDGISRITMATPWAMASVLSMNVARSVRAGPQGVTPALKYQRTEVDEEGAGECERNKEWRNSSGLPHGLIPTASLHFR